MIDNDAVKLQISDGIANIVLNRPDKYNAYIPEMGEGILESLEKIECRDDVGCVVLEGRGKAFSAGGDIDSMGDRLGKDIDPVSQATRLSDGPNNIITRLFRFPLPTIAKVDGLAVGAGSSFALACDVLLASDRTKIGFSFRRVGLTVDTGISYLLPRLVGANIAKELIYTGELIDADRGLEIGLFNHVYPSDEFDDQCNSIARTISDGPTRVLRHGKRLIDDSNHQSLESAIGNEAITQGAMIATPEHQEGVQSFIEDREPEFDNDKQ